MGLGGVASSASDAVGKAAGAGLSPTALILVLALIAALVVAAVVATIHQKSKKEAGGGEHDDSSGGWKESSHQDFVDPTSANTTTAASGVHREGAPPREFPMPDMDTVATERSGGGGRLSVAAAGLRESVATPFRAIGAARHQNKQYVLIRLDDVERGGGAGPALSVPDRALSPRSPRHATTL
ncbi:hypothetical protein B0T24DRAFT_165252 [Lasiosphaeria ovina]|uniref:Uncharacterized protein n=1 Tax=Lasiosphaeria ovina TaxID=92902 RepID=A0AAE0NDW9_9PEZI|nr:hypothetical protein B0T24DRAFT_165252 [Lasiosphaeria ovina]